VDEVIRSIRRVAINCGFEFLGNLDAGVLERHLAAIIAAGRSYRTRNAAFTNVHSFINWLLRTHKLPRDPIQTISRLNEEADPKRRRRRALTADEFERLLATTKSEASPTREGLTGEQRATIYLLAAWSGLRKSELAKLKITDLSLDTVPPFVHLPAAAAKARRDDGAIPLHPFVASELGLWVQKRLSAGNDMLFDLTTSGGHLRRTSLMMEEDCQAAGIPYKSHAGIADFHSHRLAFITHLSRTCDDFSLVSELARHRDPKLTAKIYDKVRMEDRMAAIDALPLPTGRSAQEQRSAKRGPRRAPRQSDGKRTA
jgi:integrase